MGLQIRALSAGKPSVTAVEVEVNGQRVINGSVISTAGLLLVTSTQRARLYCDGVKWSPVSIEDNIQRYSLTTGGRFTIFVGDKLVFTFVNEYTPDFEFGRNALTYFRESENIGGDSETGTYVQTQWNQEATRVRVNVYPRNMADVEELEFTSNQEIEIVKTTQTNYVQAMCSNIDKTQPLEIFLGNVLLAYVYV